jgi:hypothetical protein
MYFSFLDPQEVPGGVRYNKAVYSVIRLSRHHRRIQEYINATFKSSWRGSLPRWFLVDMHVEPQWMHRHLLPPTHTHIHKKQGEPEMTLHLTALVKQVAKVCDASLRACHCAEEFTHWQIRPLNH